MSMVGSNAEGICTRGAVRLARLPPSHPPTFYQLINFIFFKKMLHLLIPLFDTIFLAHTEFEIKARNLAKEKYFLPIKTFLWMSSL
jgi:hypothetical protein